MASEIKANKISPANRHYAAIMELVNARTLTIAEADE